MWKAVFSLSYLGAVTEVVNEIFLILIPIKVLFWGGEEGGCGLV